MRFFSEGPTIPDELIEEHDQGNVVFFCGAGVSKQEAKPPVFWTLLETVMQTLRSAPESNARMLLQGVESLNKPGYEKLQRMIKEDLLSADRIFTLLEEEFGGPLKVASAVAKALNPGIEPNVRAHKILLDLSRNGDKTRLITVNFDLLFEKAMPNVPSKDLTSSQLSGRFDNRNFEGIIHLHGRVNDNYDNADGDGMDKETNSYSTGRFDRRGRSTMDRHCEQPLSTRFGVVHRNQTTFADGNPIYAKRSSAAEPIHRVSQGVANTRSRFG